VYLLELMFRNCGDAICSMLAVIMCKWHVGCVEMIAYCVRTNSAVPNLVEFNLLV